QVDVDFGHEVAYHREIEGFRHAGDLEPSRDAAGAHEVNHDDVHRARFHHLTVRRRTVQVLAAGNRRRERVGHAGKPLEIVGRCDVLEPEQAYVLDPRADVDRLLDPPALVDIAHEVDARSDALAHLADAVYLYGGRSVPGQGELRLHLAEP